MMGEAGDVKSSGCSFLLAIERKGPGTDLQPEPG